MDSARPADAAAPPGASAVGRAALLLAGFVVAGLALRYAGLSALHVRKSASGAAMILALGAVLTAVGVPRQVVAFAGGYAFGAIEGFALSLVAQIMGCALDYGWARAVAGNTIRTWAERRLGQRWGRLHAFLTAKPFAATLTLRLLPVGNNTLLSVFAGLAGLRAMPFLFASLVGYVPQTAIFALAGSGTRVDKTAQLGIAAVLFALSALLGLWLMRTHRRQV